LLEFAGGDAVDGVEEAGDGVEEGAAAGVQGHEVEGCYGEDDAEVACASILLAGMAGLCEG